jgi:WW domain-binding protein 4|tara:strand:+ start:2316 stop:3461 length:1146 start_codon:yes stop_codon:yes gene_type:complete
MNNNIRDFYFFIFLMIANPDFEPNPSHFSAPTLAQGGGKDRVKMSDDVKKAKYSLSKQGQPDWCHFCKCYVQSHSNSKRSHEQSNAHKKNVELKMREVRQQKQNEGKEVEAKQRMMANIESAAAKAYKADLAARARPEDAGNVPPLSAGARQGVEEEGAKKEIDEKGAWKFDDRSNYYWHAKSSHYFDPKSGMFFNTKTNNAWSNQAPANVPAPPSASGETAATPSTATERAAEPASTSVPTAGGSGALGVSAARATGGAGLAHTPKASAAAGTTNAKSLTSMFNLGYGTNHPKYEAAKAKTQTSALRALDGAGGRKFEAADAKKLGVVTGTGDNGKRNRDDGGTGGKKPKLSKEEAAAIAKREAARARVEARTKKSFGLQ